MDQLVIFGGTFNPVHFGHLIMARSVAEQLGASKVTLMPAAVPPHKGAPATEPHHRLAMLELAVEGDPLFEVSTLELDRSGPSYTYDTLRQLREIHGLETQLVWVVGMDMLRDLASWYRAGDVVDMARIVTAARPPMPADLTERLDRLGIRFNADQIARLAGGILDTPLVDISSTQIRHRVRDGKSIRYLTADSVIKYIREHELYRRSDMLDSGSQTAHPA